MSDVLLVVANAAGPLSVGDTAIRGWLLAAGHTVTLASDETVPVPSGFDVHVITESTAPGVMAAYRDRSEPVVLFEGNLGDDFGLVTNGTGTTNGGSSTTMQVLGNHPITEGVPAGPAAYFAPASAQWGYAPAAVCPGGVVFMLNNPQTFVTGVAVDVGDELWSGLAKRRMAFLSGVDSSAVGNLTPAVGQLIFLQAVAWAAFQPPVPPVPVASGILTAMDTVTDQLAAVDGLRASQDISKVNAPGVWVTLQDVRPEFMDGSGTAALYLYLIAPNVAFRDVVRILDDLLGKVSSVVPTEGDIQPVSLVVSDGKATLPAWRLTSLATYHREA